MFRHVHNIGRCIKCFAVEKYGRIFLTKYFSVVYNLLILHELTNWRIYKFTGVDVECGFPVCDRMWVPMSRVFISNNSHTHRHHQTHSHPEQHHHPHTPRQTFSSRPHPHPQRHTAHTLAHTLTPTTSPPSTPTHPQLQTRKFINS